MTATTETQPPIIEPPPVVGVLMDVNSRAEHAVPQTVVSENPRSCRKTTEEEWSSVSRSPILILPSEFRG